MKITNAFAWVLAAVFVASSFSGCIGDESGAKDSDGSNGSSSNFIANVRDYGAAGDGATLDTKAINDAIQACNLSGGGTVYFPEGTYVSGSIHLCSNLALDFANGATLLGAPAGLNAYDAPEPASEDYQDFGHSHFHNALMWGENLTNISLIGSGAINGGGVSNGDPPSGDGDKIIALKYCSKIVLRDIQMLKGGHFCVLFTGCDDILIENVYIDTDRDGIDIDCCSNFTIRGTYVNSPIDDAIVPKSSYALGYGRICENGLIENCYVSGYITENSGLTSRASYVPGLYEAIKSTPIGDYDIGGLLGKIANGGGGVGRLKLGTESNAGFRNITFRDCNFENCWGLALETVDGGVLENITATNLKMQDVFCPIFFRLGDRARGPNDPQPGKIQNVYVNNITVVRNLPITAVSVTRGDTVLGSIISGIPGYQIGPNVILDNITILCNGGGQTWMSNSSVPENEDAYPEPTMFSTYMPAYGFYIRHVNGMEFKNIKLTFAVPDWRPAVIFEDAQNVTVSGFSADQAPGGEPSIVFR